MTQEIVVPESADDETVAEIIAAVYESAEKRHKT
jgi:hypothetical protein